MTSRRLPRCPSPRVRRLVAPLLILAVLAGMLVQSAPPPAPVPGPDDLAPAASTSPATELMLGAISDALKRTVLEVGELPSAPEVLPLTTVDPFGPDALDLQQTLEQWVMPNIALRGASSVAALRSAIVDAANRTATGGRTVTIGEGVATESSTEARVTLPVTYQRTFTVPVRIPLDATGMVEGGLVTYTGMIDFTLDVRVDKTPGLSEDQAKAIVLAKPPTSSSSANGTVVVRFGGVALPGPSATRFGFTNATITPAPAPYATMMFDTVVVDPNTGDGRLKVAEILATPAADLLRPAPAGATNATFDLAAPDINGTMQIVVNDANTGDATPPTITTTATNGMDRFGRMTPSAAFSGMSSFQGALLTVRRLGGAQIPMVTGSLAPLLEQAVPAGKVAELQSVVCNTTRLTEGKAEDLPYQPSWYPAGTVFRCAARTPVRSAAAVAVTWRIKRSTDAAWTATAHSGSAGTDPTEVELTLPGGAGLPQIEATWNDLDGAHVAQPPAATMQDVRALLDRAGLAGTAPRSSASSRR